MVRPTSLIDLNPVELKYYPLMISLSSGNCNVFSPRIYIPKKTKDINVKAFIMITSKYEAKTMTKHISCDCKYKFNITTCNSNKKWSNKTCQYERKNYRKCKKHYSWIPSTCICENSKYLKIISDDSKFICDKIISVMDIVSIKMTSTMATYMLINSDSKKVRNCYIF